MIRLRFFVAGLPRSLQVGTSVSYVKDGIRHEHQQRRNTPWAVLVGHEGRQHAPATPWTGAVRVELRFYLPRPGAAPRRVTLPTKRPDLESLIHRLTDQWTGVFWADDSQIVDLVCRKRFAVDGRVGVDVIVTEAVDMLETAVISSRA